MQTVQNATAGYTLLGKHGLTADPRGAIATFTIGERDYLVDVIGVYRAERGVWILKTRHFNGEDGPDVALVHVQLLHRR